MMRQLEENRREVALLAEVLERVRTRSAKRESKLRKLVTRLTAKLSGTVTLNKRFDPKSLEGTSLPLLPCTMWG